MKASLIFLAFLAYVSSSATSSQAAIANLSVLRERLWTETANATRFDVTGYVAFVCNGDTTRIDLVDGDSHHQFWLSTSNSCPVRGGDLARLRGRFGPPPENIRREISSPLAPYVDQVDLLGKAPPRHYDEISGVRLVSGGFTNAAVSVRGILSGAHRDELNANWNWFVLRTPTGKVYAATPDRENALATLQSLSDAEVTVCGTATPAPRLKGLSGFQLLVVGDRGIVCTKRPTDDPFTCQDLAEGIRRMVDPNPRKPVSLHRNLIHGTVLGCGNGRLFLRTTGEVFCSVVPLSVPPGIVPGCHVVAAGFLEYELSGLEFVDAHVRLDATNRAPLSPGKPIDAKVLSPSTKGNLPINPRCDGEAVTIFGIVANSTESIRHDGIIRLICGDHTVSVDIRSTFGSPPHIVDKGYGLSVTGIAFCGTAGNRSTGGLPFFTGFTIYPRVQEDIVVRSKPSWWTTGRLLGVILALMVLIVAILVWNRSLAVLSDRRGKRLYREALAHTKAEMKIEERTHLAVELHDALSQTLTGVALQLDSACLANRGGNARVGQILEVAKSMLASCRRELHNCLWDLRSRAFDEENMSDAVMRTLAPYADGIGISIRFNVPRAPFEETLSHAILRMVRELAVNAINHGHATRLWISGELHDGTVAFSVHDNGCGFDPNDFPGPRQGHFGLQGIRERLEKLDGDIDIQSKPGQGSKIRIHLKVQKKDNE